MTSKTINGKVKHKVSDKPPTPWYKLVAQGYGLSLLSFVVCNVTWTILSTYVEWDLSPVWEWKPGSRGALLAVSHIPLLIKLCQGMGERDHYVGEEDFR